MSPSEIAVVVIASALGALVKGVTGMGYPVLAMPLIALVAGVEDAVVVVAAPNLAANVYLCWESRGSRHETRDLPSFVGSGVIGAIVGTVALVHLPESPLLVVLAAAIALFVVQYLRRPDLRLDAATARRWSPLVGGVAGVLQGAVGVSGPVVALWMHGYRLQREVFVHSITLVFGVTGAVQLVVLAAQGQFSWSRTAASAAAALPVALMIPLGLQVRSALGGPAFERAVLGVLVVSAVSLVVRVVG